jgi:hypothetical protein
MPPRTRALLRVQNPDNDSDSSDEGSERGGVYSMNGRGTYTNNSQSLRALSPSNSTLVGLVINTPVSEEAESPPFFHQSSRPNGYGPPATTTSNSRSPTPDKTPPPPTHQSLSASLPTTMMVSSSLPSQSYMPFQYESRGLHERRPSDSQRPMNVCFNPVLPIGLR